MNTNNTGISNNMRTGQPTGAPSAADQTAAEVSRQADQAIAAGKRATQNAADSVQAGLDSMRETVPGMVTNLAHNADELLHKGAERAKQAGAVVRDKAHDLQTQTEAYVREQPVKAVLFAAAAGAILAMLLSRPHHGR